MSLKSLALSLALLSLAACGSSTPDSIVGDGPVAQDAFCDTMDAVLAQGRANCCGAVENPALSCTDAQQLFAAVASSDGAVEYDAEGAGDLLRSLEASSESCQVEPASIHDALTGTLPEGADCSLDDAPELRSVACAEGLRCATELVDEQVEYVCRADDDTGRLSEGASCASEDSRCDDGLYCGEDDTCTSLLDGGASCASGSTCQSGTCTDGTTDDDGELTCGGGACTCTDDTPSFCEEAVPPANATPSPSAFPKQLCVTVADVKYAGTDQDVVLTYVKSAHPSYVYWCKIDAPISRDTERCCNTYSSPRSTPISYEHEGKTQMGIVYKTSTKTDNGVCVENFKMEVYDSGTSGSTTWYKRGTFHDVYDPINCDSCSIFDTNCDRCWIDGDNGPEEEGFTVVWDYSNRRVINRDDGPMSGQWPNSTD